MGQKTDRRARDRNERERAEIGIWKEMELKGRETEGQKRGREVDRKGERETGT